MTRRRASAGARGLEPATCGAVTVPAVQTASPTAAEVRAPPPARPLRSWHLVADVGVALLVGLAAASSSRWLGAGPPGRWSWFELALPATLMLRRRLPALAFSGSVVLILVQVAVLERVLLVDGVLLAALYAVVARSSRTAGAAAVLVSVSGCLVAAALPFGRLPVDGALRAAAVTAAFLAALVVSTTAAAALAHQRAGRLQALHERAERVERDRARDLALAAERERTRIARDVHDVVAHSFAVIVAQAQSGSFVAAQDPAQAVAALDAVAGTAREALADVRDVLSVMRHPPTTNDMADLAARARAAGLDVHYEEEGAASDAMDPRVAETAYRSLQEALTNAIKHADPSTRVDVRASWGATDVRIEVADRGPTNPLAAPPGGAGLNGMRARVDELGGEMGAGPGPDGGWVVSVAIPLRGG